VAELARRVGDAPPFASGRSPGDRRDPAGQWVGDGASLLGADPGRVCAPTGVPPPEPARRLPAPGCRPATRATLATPSTTACGCSATRRPSLLIAGLAARPFLRGPRPPRRDPGRCGRRRSHSDRQRPPAAVRPLSGNWLPRALRAGRGERAESSRELRGRRPPPRPHAPT
jgi:hypothetical protein